MTQDITRFMEVKIFSEIGKQTPVFVRFSTVAGERGAADAERDIRGFALKFYTEEGNWDLVGNNTPVFFFRDPRIGCAAPTITGISGHCCRKRRTRSRSSCRTAASRRASTICTDLAANTYSMINAANERVWVKFHFRTQQDIQDLTDAEAEALVAKDRESHGRDLFNAIESGDFPRWTLLHPGHDGGPGEDAPAQPVRPDQGLAEG